MHLRFSTECTSNILRVTETSSVPAVVSAVLGVIIALLVVVIISLSIAIHRLRRALQQQKSASRSAGPYSVHHKLRGSASTVLTASRQVNGRWRILTPIKSKPLSRFTHNLAQLIMSAR